MKNRVVIILLGLILLIGLFVRSSHLYIWPREGATFDEHAWTFLGLSLLNTGIPTSWSPHAAYTDRKEYRNPNGARFTLVTPYLEHPPLFGYIAGLSARAFGARGFDDVNLRNMRPLSLALGLVSIGLVYLVTAGWYGSSVALIASLMYAITPTVAVGSRLLQNENFFIPVFLSMLYLANTIRKQPSKTRSFLLYILAYMIPLAKVPWMAAPVAVAVILFSYSRKSEAFWVIVSSFMGVVSYILWGLYWSPGVFVLLMRLQTARYDMAFDGIFSVFMNPVVTDRLFIDGWVYFGWFAIAILVAKLEKRHIPLIISFFAYLSIYLFAIPNEPGHGWYRYPFYPFLTIASAVVLTESYRLNAILRFLFFIIVGLSMMADSWGKAFGFSHLVYRWYLLSAGITAIPFMTEHRYIRTISQVVSNLIMVLIFMFSIWSVLSYTEQ